MDSNEFKYDIFGKTLTYPSPQIAYFKARKTFLELARKLSAEFPTDWRTLLHNASNTVGDPLVRLTEKYEHDCARVALTCLANMGCYSFTEKQLLNMFSFQKQAEGLNAVFEAKRSEMLNQEQARLSNEVAVMVEQESEQMLGQEIFTDTDEVYIEDKANGRGLSCKYHARPPAIDLILLLSRKMKGDTSVNSKLREMIHIGEAIFAVFDAVSAFGGKARYQLGKRHDWDGVGRVTDHRDHCDPPKYRGQKVRAWRETHVHVTAAQNRERLKKYYVNALMAKYVSEKKMEIEQRVASALINYLACGDGAELTRNTFFQAIIGAYNPLLKCYDKIGIPYSGVKRNDSIAAICENIRSGVVPADKIPEQCFNILSMDPYYPDGYKIAKAYYGDPTGDLARMEYDFGITASVASIPVSEFERAKKAAVSGDANAQFTLGRYYAKGQNVSQNIAEAVAWFRKAAEQEHANAQLALGFHYLNGQGVTEDVTEAVKWFNKAARNGNVTAQFNIGRCYEEGRGVVKDVKEAVIWYRKAAEQGHARAQDWLSRYYSLENGVSKDINEAIRWQQGATEQKATNERVVSPHADDTEGKQIDNAAQHNEAFERGRAMGKAFRGFLRDIFGN